MNFEHLAPASPLLDEFDRLIRNDPARRGLISSEAIHGPLCPGHLAAAAKELAHYGESVAVVTGFFIPRATPPAAETDGPLGAALLVRVLRDLGRRAMLVTDAFCAGAVRAAAECYGVPADEVCVPDCTVPTWPEVFLASDVGRSLTHLMAVERVGPSHTLESFRSQSRSGPPPVAEFNAAVPPEHRNHCHNMRGVIVDDCTPPLHRLFESAGRLAPGIKTIGIGDGGNEIGMGAVPWEEVAGRLQHEHAGRIACRIATDFTIVAGVSNWGAQALIAGVCALLGRADVLERYDRAHERHALEQVVQIGPAVDGITAQYEAAVDGLPFITYLQPWEAIRRLLVGECKM